MLVSRISVKREGVPFSTPKKSSNGRPVSLHVGKGIYCNWPLASVIYPSISCACSITPSGSYPPVPWHHNHLHVRPFLCSVISATALQSGQEDSHCPIQTAHRNRLANPVSTTFLHAFQRLLTRQRLGKRNPESVCRDKGQPEPSRWGRHCVENSSTANRNYVQGEAITLSISPGQGVSAMNPSSCQLVPIAINLGLGQRSCTDRSPLHLRNTCIQSPEN